MKSKFSQAGFSIPEAVFAIGIGAIAVAGGMVVNQEQLRLVKSTRHTSSVSLLLEERVEQLRIANWRQITDSAYLSDKYFKVVPRSARTLGDHIEHITITAFPDANACTPLELECLEDGSVRVTANGTGLNDQKLAKVSVGVTWKGNGRTRVRELATVISNAGISRMNLPSLGAGFGGTSETSWSGTENSTGTTDTTSTTTTTTTTTEQSGNNGNGNGRGNVAGKPGKA